MVVSCFGPYHHLVYDDAPTERAGVILTPWAMPLVLGAWFGRNSSGGRLALGPITTMYLFDFMVSPPSQVCHEYVFIFALASSQFLSSPDRAPSFLMGHPGGGWGGSSRHAIRLPAQQHCP